MFSGHVHNYEHQEHNPSTENSFAALLDEWVPKLSFRKAVPGNAGQDSLSPLRLPHRATRAVCCCPEQIGKAGEAAITGYRTAG